MDPGLVGVAVKVTGTPAQTGLTEAEMFTLTGKSRLTSSVMALEVAGLFEVQTVSEDVSSQVTISLFNGV